MGARCAILVLSKRVVHGAFCFSNAVAQHNTFIVGKAPLVCGLTSRCSLRQRRQAHEGRFVFGPRIDETGRRANAYRFLAHIGTEVPMHVAKYFTTANPGKQIPNVLKPHTEA
jgi:hypothetical protein